MKISKDIDKKFGRDEIKTRMIDLASRLHGYEHFEMESFDPLVDLMLSALAKELEKSHLFFQDTFNDLCNHIINRLIPESEISFVPSSSILHIKAEAEAEIHANNLKCTVVKEDESGEQELSFVPLLPYKLSSADVKLIANGSKLIKYEGLDAEDLIDYEATTSSIYLGVKFQGAIPADFSLPIYFTWFEHPNTDVFLDILDNSEWFLDGHEIKVKKSLMSAYEQEELLQFWDKSYFKETFKDISKVYNHKYFRLSIPSDLLELRSELPLEILELVKKQPELSYANELNWVEIKLPSFEKCRNLGLKLFAQTNCSPFINLKEHFETHKVRPPYKVVRIAGNEYFVDVKKLYNYNEGEYLPRYNLQTSQKDIQGYYSVARNSVLRIDKRVAISKIVQLMDLVREERNAFSSFNPDWIIDELQKIKVNFQRIEYKLGENLNIDPHDVFITLEDEEQDNTIRIEYWTCSGNNANGVQRGSVAELETEHISLASEALFVESSIGGSFSVEEKEKLQRLKYQLQTKDRIVTRADMNTAISFKLAPIVVKEVEYRTEYLPVNNFRVGYVKTIVVSIHISVEPDDNINLNLLQRSLENFINERIVSETNYKFEIISS